MARVFIGVGSNINPEENIKKAFILLKEKTRLKKISQFYQTEPMGAPGQPPFYNGVVEIESAFSPLELKNEVLRQIEDSLGRVRSNDKNSPRTIDLDVLLYGDIVFESEGLVVPDPEITERAFLALPLFELAPQLVLPESREPLKAIAQRFEVHDMMPLVEFTRSLREEVLGEKQV